MATKKNAPAKSRGSAESRSRKFQLGERVCANADAAGEYRARCGFVTELGPGRSEYRVEFDDGQRPTTGYLL